MLLAGEDADRSSGPKRDRMCLALWCNPWCSSWSLRGKCWYLDGRKVEGYASYTVQDAVRGGSAACVSGRNQRRRLRHRTSFSSRSERMARRAGVMIIARNTRARTRSCSIRGAPEGDDSWVISQLQYSSGARNGGIALDGSTSHAEVALAVRRIWVVNCRCLRGPGTSWYSEAVHSGWTASVSRYQFPALAAFSRMLAERLRASVRTVSWA